MRWPNTLRTDYVSAPRDPVVSGARVVLINTIELAMPRPTALTAFSRMSNTRQPSKLQLQVPRVQSRSMADYPCLTSDIIPRAYQFQVASVVSCKKAEYLLSKTTVWAIGPEQMPLEKKWKLAPH